MKNGNIALVSYQVDYFQTFQQALEAVGFKVFWICANRSDAALLINKFNVPSERITDIDEGFGRAAVENADMASCRESVLALETDQRPKINDIVLMDRVLRHKSTEFAFQYIDHLNRKLTDFLKTNDISMISSGRDTAIQLTSMMVARKLQIPWVVPTRLRIPLNSYGFSTSHETDAYIKFTDVSEDDRVWARNVINNFSDKQNVPALKISARNFMDTVRLVIPHAEAFYNLAKRGYRDRGNDYARYTLGKIIKMYFTRRLNMVKLKFVRPWSKIGNTPFCLYALQTQPESSIDVAGSYYSDQVALIRNISRSLPASHELYVKIHPSDVDGKNLDFYRSISASPSVRLVHDDITSRELIAKCDLVFTLTGTIGFESALLGKPVVTFARNYYNAFPTVHYCDNPPELGALITHIWQTELAENIAEQIIECLAELHTCIFHGEVNRNFGASPTTLNNDDLETLQVAYQALHEQLVVKPKMGQGDVRRPDFSHVPGLVV